MFNESAEAVLMCAVVTTMKTRHSRHEPRSEVTGVREGLATQKGWHYGKTECQQGQVKEPIHYCLCSHFIFHGKDYKFWRLISSVLSRAPLHTPWWWQMVWPSDIQSRVALPCCLSIWPAFREREREGRETAKSLWDSSTAPCQVNSQTTPHRTQHFCCAFPLHFLLSFLSRPRHKRRGCLQTRQLHCGQQSSLFLQFQLPITDTTESISDIKVW